MDTVARAQTGSSITFPYYCIRRINAPEDEASGREVYAGHAPATSFLGFPADENVREYMLEAEGKKRRRPTDVHKAMQETLRNSPENFSILNGGIVLVARKVVIDDKNRVAILNRPSIINGSQTQGVLKDYFNEFVQNGDPNRKPFPVHVKFEMIITQDDNLIAETSIARNFQNDVMRISIVGRLGQLDELEANFQKRKPGTKLRKSETKLSEDYVLTEKLLQVITALVPDELWPYENEKGSPNKVFTYSMKAKCLKDFQTMWQHVHPKPAHDRVKENPDSEITEEKRRLYEDLYKFYLDIAAEAWDLYEKWKQHEKFYGTRLRSIEREGRQIVDIPDGIVFPILASLSAFATKKAGTWTIAPPASFSDAELIKAAVDVYQQIADSNPNKMGKLRACYSSLYQITSIYRRLSQAE